MNSVTQAFRDHHRELANQLSKYVAQIVDGKADADPRGFAAFLKNELLPHAAGEESALYPRMDEIIKPLMCVRLSRHNAIRSFFKPLNRLPRAKRSNW